MTSSWNEYDETYDDQETDFPGPEDDPVAARKALLQSLADGEGPLADLAKEALVALEEREAREAAASQAAANFEALDAASLPDLLDRYESLRLTANGEDRDEVAEVADLAAQIETVKEVLRAQVFAKNAATDRKIVAETERILRAQGSSDEDVDREVGRLKDQQAALGAYGGDPLDDSTVWRAVLSSRAENARARKLALELTRPSWEDEVAAAKLGMAETLHEVLARG